MGNSDVGNEMENELLLSKIEEFEYPELDLEAFSAEDVLTADVRSGIEKGGTDDFDSDETDLW